MLYINFGLTWKSVYLEQILPHITLPVVTSVKHCCLWNNRWIGDITGKPSDLDSRSDTFWQRLDTSFTATLWQLGFVGYLKIFCQHISVKYHTYCHYYVSVVQIFLKSCFWRITVFWNVFVQFCRSLYQLHGVTFQNSVISTVIAVMTICVSVRNRSNVEVSDKTTQEIC